MSHTDPASERPTPDDDGLLIYGSHVATFGYRNWRGEVARRRIGVISVWYGSTEWHPEPQWFMRGIDLDKTATRDFAMRDMADVSYT